MSEDFWYTSQIYFYPRHPSLKQAIYPVWCFFVMLSLNSRVWYSLPMVICSPLFLVVSVIVEKMKVSLNELELVGLELWV